MRAHAIRWLSLGLFGWIAGMELTSFRGAFEPFRHATPTSPSAPGNRALAGRLLAESALEEALHALWRETPFRQKIHAGLPGILAGEVDRRVDLGSFHPTITLREAGDGAGESAQAPAIVVQVRAWKEQAPSSDPAEGTGLLELESLLTRAGTATPDWRLRRRHRFRLARVVPALAVSGVRLLLQSPPPEMAGTNGADPLIYVPGPGEPASFADIFTVGVEKGSLGSLAPADRPAIDRLMSDSMSDILTDRAHFLVRSPEEMVGFLRDASSRGTRVDGVVHCLSRELVTLSLPSFRGNALLSFDGPLLLEDVRMKDPGVDRLTLVTSDVIRVNAERVEAGLIALFPGVGQVRFERRSTLRGFLYSWRFPTTAEATRSQDLQESRVEGWPEPLASDATGGGSSPGLPELVLQVAPYPESVEFTPESRKGEPR